MQSHGQEHNEDRPLNIGDVDDARQKMWDAFFWVMELGGGLVPPDRTYELGDHVRQFVARLMEWLEMHRELMEQRPPNNGPDFDDLLRDLTADL